MESNPYAAPAAELKDAGSDSDVKSGDFYVVGVTKFTILFFATFALYPLYWFYRNWRAHKEATNANIWPVPRAIFSIFFTHSLFSIIDASLKSTGKSYNWKPSLVATLYVVFSIVSHMLDRLSMKEIGSPLTDVLSLAILPALYYPLLIAQKAVNQLEGDPEGEANQSLTVPNFLWMLLGIIFWALAIFGLLIMFGVIVL
ncbi:hypothetical protein [Neptuniibacter caesariensis]|uniref:Membrane protein, putative n=1 Tax=Neptuniibacter caesariensis TaxID=207954 RepID=A0A7U8C1X8_NEPCE|nr:hypothetical protein [Neptuniibacter caesariensis]EAR59985.1 membrane protein, putative [Oceanospirillum sp. MED92] [Neptuniibacter caesariensis]